MDLVVGLIWAYVSAKLVWDNMDLLESASIWRAVVAIVILVVGTPVFFLSDVLEIILDFIIPDRSEE